MAVSRAERRRDRQPAVVGMFGEQDARAVLDLFEIVELAWHDCYGEVTPPPDVIADMLLVSDGSVDKLIAAARLAMTDWRDLRLAADERRTTH